MKADETPDYHMGAVESREYYFDSVEEAQAVGGSVASIPITITWTYLDADGKEITTSNQARLPDIDVDPTCDCGGKTAGYADYNPGHSSWCQVAPGKKP